jgi:disulfide bond formation protein DsbB
MYPLSLILLIGLVEQDELVHNYVLPFSVVGIGLSTYHYLIQQGLFGNTSACIVGIPCSARYVNYLGFITIPFMALTAFVLITVFMWLRRRAA